MKYVTVVELSIIIVGYKGMAVILFSNEAVISSTPDPSDKSWASQTTFTILSTRWML